MRNLQRSYTYSATSGDPLLSLFWCTIGANDLVYKPYQTPLTFAGVMLLLFGHVPFFRVFEGWLLPSDNVDKQCALSP